MKLTKLEFLITIQTSWYCLTAAILVQFFLTLCGQNRIFRKHIDDFELELGGGSSCLRPGEGRGGAVRGTCAGEPSNPTNKTMQLKPFGPTDYVKS